MQVDVLIPVHNRIDATIECLDCLKVQTYKDIKIIVVDDGSTDGTYERIRESFPEVEILRGDGNLWWTGAMHMGVEHILKYAKEGAFVLSLNNDTAFEPDFVESLVSTSKEYGRAVVGSMEIDYYDRKKILYRGEWLDWKEFRFNVEKGPIENSNITCNEHVNVLPGRGLLIPVEVFGKIGNFNKWKCPHYIADYEFTMRAFRTGFKLILSYNSVIYSKQDLTGISIKDGRRSLKIHEWFTQYFSRKSDHNVVDHINFILLHCPQPYKVRNIIFLLASTILRLRILYPLQRMLHAVRSKESL